MKKMILQTSIAATLLTAGGFIAAKTASQTRGAATTKTSAATVEKAPTACRVEAYGFGLGDAEKTANIRVKPDKNAAILKTVTTVDETIYSISGSDGKGWFEVTKIEAVSDVEATLFEGRGWVHASNLDLSVAHFDPKLRDAPNAKSRVIKTLIADESEARPLACAGDWMKIKSGKSVGWLSPDGQCANPLTTCS